MTDLVAEFGYYSSGESFSIADPNEVWILELIGKGEGQKGAVWVARKIPDGYISGHANQARITSFPQNDSENCIYAEDVISFAREKGWYKGTDKDFSFSDVYAPVDFGGARFCDARVWAGFNKVVGGMEEFTSYAMGKVEHGGENNFPTNRMPLWVKPDNKVSVQDVMDMMRDHFEDTPLDMTQDCQQEIKHFCYAVSCECVGCLNSLKYWKNAKDQELAQATWQYHHLHLKVEQQIQLNHKWHQLHNHSYR